MIEQVAIDTLRLPARQLRQHPERQLVKLAASIEQFGFIVPVLISPEREVIVGVARVAAAKRLGLTSVQAIEIAHLNPAQIRAFRIADNRLAELASWDEQSLRLEFKDLGELDLDFELELTGFETAEIDLMVDAVVDNPADPADEVPAPPTTAVSRRGDLLNLGANRLLCGDALDPDSYERLMAGEKARLVHSDPPFNVQIQGHVSGLGRISHREFAMASGEMSETEFTQFLQTALANYAANLVDGGLLQVFIDAAHHYHLGGAYRNAGLRLLNICTWAKTNAGMGSLYRSQTELVFILKAGKAPHVNNVQLGKYGRYRTTLWTYAGQNTFHANRDEELSAHPTVKPVALAADAIRDCTRRGEIVLDGFAGSGTTILAAERTGRRARAIELDPVYVDVAVQRWQKMTGRSAIHAETGLPFDALAVQRKTEAAVSPPGANDGAPLPQPPATPTADPVFRVRRRPSP